MAKHTVWFGKHDFGGGGSLLLILFFPQISQLSKPNSTCNDFTFGILVLYYATRSKSPVFSLCTLVEVRTVTSGPFYFAGHSFGASLCLEMARQAEVGERRLTSKIRCFFPFFSSFVMKDMI